jgi:SAM-dependent methyltransferase
VSHAGLERGLVEDPVYRNALPDLLERLGSVSGRTVVEIGCGDGFCSLLLASRGARVVGFDPRPGAIRRARSLAADAELAERCSFVRGRAEAIPLPDRCADVVFSRSSLQYVDRRRALAEATRILEPGGTLALLENLPDHPLINLHRRLRGLVARAVEPDLEIRGYVSLAEIDALGAEFDLERVEWELTRVVSIALEVRLGARAWVRALDAAAAGLDRWLLARLPIARRLAWLVVVVARRKAG